MFEAVFIYDPIEDVMFAFDLEFSLTYAYNLKVLFLSWCPKNTIFFRYALYQLSYISCPWSNFS